MPVRLHHVVVDTHDLPSLARFWTRALGWTVLSRRVGGLQTGRTLRALVRMSLAGLGTFLVMALAQRLVNGRLTDPSRVMALLDIALVGSLGLVTYLELARAMRVTEVTEMVAFVRRRLPGGR